MTLTVANRESNCGNCGGKILPGMMIDFIVRGKKADGRDRNVPIHGVCPSPKPEAPSGGTPSAPSVPSPASGSSPPAISTRTEMTGYELSISAERETAAPPGYVAGRLLLRLQTRVTGPTLDSIGAEIRKLRELADSNLMGWEYEVFPPIKPKKAAKVEP